MPDSSEELTRFVRKSLEKDVPRAEIESALRDAGWPEDDVSKSLQRFAETDFPIPVPRPLPYLSAREAFLYLLLFTSLFLSAFYLGSVLFELIEKAFPDPSGGRYSEDWLRWSISFVVVSFPVYVFLTLRVERELREDPAKRASKVRKWLTYVTLFVAAGFLLGDVVALLYHFLDGELTVRFFLKVLVVAGIAGTVFGYYLHDLGKDER